MLKQQIFSNLNCKNINFKSIKKNILRLYIVVHVVYGLLEPGIGAALQ